jgi:hypothetical protein
MAEETVDQAAVKYRISPSLILAAVGERLNLPLALDGGKIVINLSLGQLVDAVFGHLPVLQPQEQPSAPSITAADIDAEILAAAAKRPEVRARDFYDLWPIDQRNRAEQFVALAMNRLRAAGKLERSGQGRFTVYRLLAPKAEG